MTEAEWLACTDPERMLDFVTGKASARKLRFYACAYCRQIWQLLIDRHIRRAVEVAEGYAEGLIADSERKAVLYRASQVILRGTISELNWPPDRTVIPRFRDLSSLGKEWQAAGMAACSLASSDGRTLAHLRRFERRLVDALTRSRLLRDIFGNPFRPIALDPAWRTPTVTALATAAYDDRILPAGTLDPDCL